MAPRERCPAYSKSCAGCGTGNNFKWVSGRIMAGPIREKYKEVCDTCKDVEEMSFMWKIKNFHFPCLQSVLIVKLKTNKRTDTCEYKIDTSSDGNLATIRMLKALYWNTEITHLNKAVDTKIILHAYSNSCIPQLGVCKVNIINKSIK